MGKARGGRRRGGVKEKASDSALTLQGARTGAWMPTSKRTLLEHLQELASWKATLFSCVPFS